MLLLDTARPGHHTGLDRLAGPALGYRTYVRISPGGALSKRYDQEVEVERDAGMPAAFSWRGRRWLVADVIGRWRVEGRRGGGGPDPGDWRRRWGGVKDRPPRDAATDPPPVRPAGRRAGLGPGDTGRLRPPARGRDEPPPRGAGQAHRAGRDRSPGPARPLVRIAVCHPQTPFARGGAEMHTESLARALREAGHEADVLSIPFKWYPPAELVHQMAMWRSLDLSEAHGQTVDMIIALRFPSYLVPHEHKVVWLIHQHRTAYELWDHPAFGDISHHDEGEDVRDLIHRADRIALGEAKRIFTNSANVRDRLWRGLGMPAEVLYHRSSLCEALLEMDADPPGDYVLFPSRLDPIKRQSLAVEAMRHVRGEVRLVLEGTGPVEGELRQQVARAGLGRPV